MAGPLVLRSALVSSALRAGAALRAPVGVVPLFVSPVMAIIWSSGRRLARPAAGMGPSRVATAADGRRVVR